MVRKIKKQKLKKANSIDKQSCFCGSGFLYKDCCKNKTMEIPLDILEQLSHSETINNNYEPDEEFEEKFKKLKGVLHSTQKKSKIFQCIHPSQSECEGKIGMKAHSIQNTRIVKKLSKDNHIYTIVTKPTNFGPEFKLVGRNEATTFTGFCNKHDVDVFAPIEKENFYKGTDEQHFLYAYRAFARSYHKKLEETKGLSLSHEALSGNTDFSDNKKALTETDFKIYKNKFDTAILNKTYDILETIYIKLNKEVKFAVNSYLQLKDYKNILINDFKNFTKPLKPLMLNIFPETNESIILISCFKEDYENYKTFFEDIKKANSSELFLTLNNLIPKYCENIIVAPDFFKKWSEDAKRNYLYKYEVSNYAYILEKKIDLNEKCVYNLFENVLIV